MDLYDDAILGMGPSFDPTDTNTSPGEHVSTEHDDIDLYDDVTLQLFPEHTGRSPARYRHHRYSHHHSQATSSSHCNLYVGNLTWWTTEADMSDAIRSIGVPDFIDVKFFENASNGQSKGFCTVTLGSEESMSLVMERLPTLELHGRKPMVAYPTRNVLYQFEAQNPLRSRSRRSYR
ncbi:hypothetical protein M8J77_013204 [Diaphorina citri]|nr:hypothetical protein M8J77_013204 [Diaphorina citri]